MKLFRISIAVIFCLINWFNSIGQSKGRYNAIYSGIPWYDDRGNIVSAHGANIVKDKGRFYLFGEKHHDTSNAFAGFNCYSSTDLYNWKFESTALPVQDTGRLGPQRVGERVKVMKCPKTGGYVMFMHSDDLGYKDQAVGYATSKKITGPYTFHGPLLFNGKPIRKWDMGTFQDKDGSGYVLIHGGEIYKLSDDYRSVAEQVNKNMTSGFESPTIFKKDSLYYFLGSHLTSWERNDNYYYTATSLRGPWTARGLFAPEGTLTWNSQTTFVLPIEGSEVTTYMFMGDRWSFPKQASSATYVWQPLVVSGTSISLPEFQQAWTVDLSTGKSALVTIEGKNILSSGEQRTDVKDSSFSFKFTGTQAAWYAVSAPDCGYAKVVITNNKGKAVSSAIVDMYCKYPVSSLKYLSPILPENDYTLTVTAMGERGNWSDKSKKQYGSTGNFISIDKIVIK